MNRDIDVKICGTQKSTQKSTNETIQYRHLSSILLLVVRLLFFSRTNLLLLCSLSCQIITHCRMAAVQLFPVPRGYSKRCTIAISFLQFRTDHKKVFLGALHSSLPTLSFLLFPPVRPSASPSLSPRLPFSRAWTHVGFTLFCSCCSFL